MGLIRGLLDEVGVPTTGLIGKIGNGLGSNSNMLLGLATGGGAGAIRGAQVDAQNALQEKEEEKKQKKIADAEALAPQFNVPVQFARAFPDLMAQIAAKRFMPKDKSFEERQFDALTPEQQAQYRQQHFLNGGSEFGLSPIYGTDEQGNTVLGQLGKNGQFRPVQTPPGFKVSAGVEKIDLGTRWGLYDRRSGSLVGYEPKDIAGAEREKAVGQASGQAEVAAPGQIQAADIALDTIKQIREHPGRVPATGFSSVFPTRAGSQSADFEALLEQAKGGAFLSAIQQMRGLGQLTEKEGSAATAAVARMKLSQSEDGFLKALSDYENIVKLGKARAMRAQRGAGVGGSTGAAQSGGTSGRTSRGIGWSAE